MPNFRMLFASSAMLSLIGGGASMEQVHQTTCMRTTSLSVSGIAVDQRAELDNGCASVRAADMMYQMTDSQGRPDPRGMATGYLAMRNLLAQTPNDTAFEKAVEDYRNGIIAYAGDLVDRVTNDDNSLNDAEVIGVYEDYSTLISFARNDEELLGLINGAFLSNGLDPENLLDRRDDLIDQRLQRERLRQTERCVQDDTDTGGFSFSCGASQQPSTISSNFMRNGPRFG